MLMATCGRCSCTGQHCAAQRGDFPGPEGTLVAARGQDGKAGKQSGGVFPQGPGVLEGYDPSPGQPVTKEPSA